MRRELMKLGLGLSLILTLSTTTLLADEGKPLSEVPEKVEHTPFTTTRVSQDTTLKKLAQLYYGDENDYTVIQNANKDLSMNVPKNTEVNIPITEKFKDQPEQLDWK